MTVYIENAVTICGEQAIPAQYSRELRRADGFIRLGVQTVHELIAGIDHDDMFPRRQCGLFLGSAYGPMATNFDVLDQVINKEQTSPTLFSHSVFNAAAGYLARIFKLYGCSYTFTDFGFPFFLALQQAVASMQYGQISSCYVLQIETYSQLLEDAGKRVCRQHSPPWPTGACGWLLTNKAVSNRAQKIDRLQLSTVSAPVQEHLLPQGQLDDNGKKIPLFSPLDPVAEISKSFAENSGTARSFTLTTPFGEMILQTSP